ncbi:diacylglycerol kinase zeta-like isoform X2 [Clavelina lepadiformis]|uniref:diacylglycerol kinase zeta-like isoform X2 n=1 Tax=Clavelina lepadiformis TaxID=159417 RepID=UPI004042FDD0
MISMKKHRLKDANNKLMEVTPDRGGERQARSSFELCLTQHVADPKLLNTNNNGKHKLYHRLYSNDDGKGTSRTRDSKSIKKATKKKGEAIPSASVKEIAQRRGSINDIETKISSACQESVGIEDNDDSVMLPAEYVPHNNRSGHRRSSAHRVSYRKAIQRAGYNMNELVTASTGTRSPDLPRKAIRDLSEIDWTESAMPDDHIWTQTSASGDLCYVGEQTCQKSGARKKCSACHIVVHESCFSQLLRIGFRCKVTFREATTRSMREMLVVHHHWVHRRKQEGKCKHCGKSFEKRFGFRQQTKIVAISCSWCKEAYHNKVSCFQMNKINESCSLGTLSQSIVPPTWIIKSSQRQKSIRNRSKKKKNSTGGWRRKSAKENKSRTFIIRPLSQQAAFVSPTLVFINPKSGGNQGSKLLQAFQWFTNPRQVFDLSKSGPQEALELYRKVPNLRVLACGGDGTVGWILSVFDKLAMTKPPPVAILPLGTGNDLSRTMNFGAGYTDEPVHKIIQTVEDARLVKLDRWKLYVEKNEDAAAANNNKAEEEDASLAVEFPSSAGVDKPPLDVVNNYFGIGSDAQVALDFHESREAHPAKFNSRIGNKMYYARASMLEYLNRQSKDLSKHITVVCDGQNITPKLRELKPVCILFLNIPRFSAGTTPWGHPTGSEFQLQRHDDKLIEVLAFSLNQLGMLFVGGHGERLCQCKSAHIKTTKTFPVQIDGEPCRLNPSNIRLEFFNQVNMLSKGKRRSSVASEPKASHEQIKIRVSLVTGHDFDQHNGSKEKLCPTSVPLLVTVVMNHSTLDTVRSCLSLVNDTGKADSQSENWIFLESSSSDKLYKVDRNHESDLMVCQIINDDHEIYVMEMTNVNKIPRSKLSDRKNQYRKRVFSDSGLLASSSSDFRESSSISSLNSLGTECSLNLTDIEGDEDVIGGTLLDVVLEQPEFSGNGVNERETDAVKTTPEVHNAICTTISSASVANLDESALKEVEEDDKSSTTTLTLDQQKNESAGTDSSYFTSNNDDYIKDRTASTPMIVRQTSLMTQHVTTKNSIEPTRSLPVFEHPMLLGEFASKLSLKDSELEEATNKRPSCVVNASDADDEVLLSDFIKIRAANNNQSNNVPYNDDLETSHNWDKVFVDACKRGDIEKVVISHKNGADLCARDEDGCSALHNAARFAYTPIVSYLLKHAAPKLVDMLCRDRKQTALHKAAWYGRTDICKQLLDAGATINILDYKSKNAIDRARQADVSSLVTYLVSAQRSQQKDVMQSCQETDL